MVFSGMSNAMVVQLLDSFEEYRNFQSHIITFYFQSTDLGFSVT